MLRDTYHRPLKDLHISVTAQYNLRCTYCMPLAEYDWPEKSAILSFEDITRLRFCGEGNSPTHRGR